VPGEGASARAESGLDTLAKPWLIVFDIEPLSEPLVLPFFPSLVLLCTL